MHLSRKKLYIVALFIGITIGVGLSYWGVWISAQSTDSNNPIRKMFNTAENDFLVQRLTILEEDTNALLSELNRTRELIKLDKHARTKLTLLVNNLEAENARLKEDLAFYKDFVPGPSNQEVTLRRLEVVRDSVPNQYRYRALIVQGQKNPTIHLKIQVLVQYLVEGQPEMLVLPVDEQKSNKRFNIELKRFARIDGFFEIPEGARLDQVEVRLLDSGNIKARTSVKL